MAEGRHFVKNKDGVGDLEGCMASMDCQINLTLVHPSTLGCKG